MRKVLLLIVVVATAALAWVWLGRGGHSVEQGDPLAFVPEDTPYVFANLAPLPASTVARSLRQIDPQIAQWRRQIAQLLAVLDAPEDAGRKQADEALAPETDSGTDGKAEAAASDSLAISDDAGTGKADAQADHRFTAWLRALDAELAAAPDAASLLARLGFDPAHAKTAIYGLGVVPVSRTTLADSAAFRALVARMEKAAGETLPTLSLPGVEAGWRIALPEVPVQGIVAIADGHLILTFAPAEGDEALRTLLGLDRPARSLADSGALEKLNRAEGFTDWGSGFIDTARLAAIFRTPATPLESAFLKAIEVEKPLLPAECEADVARIIEAVPRAVAGYTRVDSQRFETLARIETSPDIAKALLTLRAPMAGLASAREAQGSFGLALKVSALPALGNRWGAATTAAPWTCPALSWINDAAEEARTGLNNPALYAAGPVLNSTLVAMDRFVFDLGTQRPSELAARLVIGSDNPASLVASARSLVPQLAALTLEPGAAPQAVPAELMMGAIEQPAFVAMDKGALGLAIGAGEDARLPGHLAADAAEQPLVFVRYRGALMGEAARLMREAAESMPEETRAELVSSAQLIEEIYVNQIEAMEMSLGLSERGIELRQKVEMKP